MAGRDQGWIPAVSISYLVETPQISWLDSVLPYVEYSSIVKDESDFNDSQMWVAGAAWARGGWYIYSDLAYSNGNYFVGNEASGGGMDDYGRIDGVGDFGVNGNDKWNYRFNSISGITSKRRAARHLGFGSMSKTSVRQVVRFTHSLVYRPNRAAPLTQR